MPTNTSQQHEQQEQQEELSLADVDTVSLTWLDELCQRCQSNDPRLTEIHLPAKDHCTYSASSSTTLIQDHHIVKLSDALRKNTTVESISLVNVNMGGEASLSFGSMIQRKSSVGLRLLYFENCGGEGLDEGIVAVATSLSLRQRKRIPLQQQQQQQCHSQPPQQQPSSPQHLQSLYFDSCSMTLTSASALGFMLSINQSLTELRICNCSATTLADASHGSDEHPLSVDSMRALALGIQGNATLQLLDLSGNSLQDEHLQILCESIASASTATSTKATTTTLLGCSRYQSKIQVLILDFNNFATRGVKAIATMLQQTTCPIQELHLFGNHISPGSAKVLAQDGIRYNTSLHTLILSLNHMGDDGIHAMWEALTYNVTLRKLWAPSNRITNAGVVALAQYLPRMNGLAQLNLGDHIIDEYAVRAVLDALPHNMHLTTLHVESPVFYIIEEEEEDEDDDSYPQQSHYHQHYKYQSHPDTLEDELEYWLSLNQCGRRLLQSTHCNFMRGLWPRIFAKAGMMAQQGSSSSSSTNSCKNHHHGHRRRGPVALLYALLREKPDLFC